MFDDKALLKAETMDEKLEGWQGDRALRRGSSTFKLLVHCFCLQECFVVKHAECIQL
jgi:hypothetical protein